MSNAVGMQVHDGLKYLYSLKQVRICWREDKCLLEKTIITETYIDVVSFFFFF
jgi:hypothetical protein